MSSTPPTSPVDWGDAPPGRAGATPPRPVRPARGRVPHRGAIGWRVLRIATMVFGLVTLCAWGYLSWPFPSPALVFMIGAPVFATVVWWLFRSPTSPVTNDIVGKVVVEIALMVAVAGAWLALGRPWVGLVFIVVAAVSGIVTFRREITA